LAASDIRDFARIEMLSDIIVTGHGAPRHCSHGHLLMPPLDYEHAIPSALQEEYAADREPFLMTGIAALRMA